MWSEPVPEKEQTAEMAPAKKLRERIHVNVQGRVGAYT